jgi:hypothetical protein
MVKVQCEYIIIDGGIKSMDAIRIDDPSSTGFEKATANYILALFKEASKTIKTPKNEVDDILKNIGTNPDANQQN